MDAQTIKDLLNERAEDFVRWLFPAGEKNGSEWQIGSLDGTAGKSLSIRIAGDKVGIFKDFATSDGGDNLLELYIQAKKVSIKEALRDCAGWLGHASTVPVVRPAKPHRKQPIHCTSASDVYELTDDEVRAALQMAKALASDFAQCERIGKGRTWQPETLQRLAGEACLGWHDGQLAFIYDCGVKLRYRHKGERIIYWAFGKAWLWRGGFIKQSQTVYLCEGETDAITLIDAGIEQEQGTTVAALPSASTFDSSWVGLFEGKDVILCFDNDKAGLRATAHVSQLLRGHVQSLKQLNWAGIQGTLPQYANAS
jgi:twinkle protein